MVWVGRDLSDHSVPSPAGGRDTSHHTRLRTGRGHPQPAPLSKSTLFHSKAISPPPVAPRPYKTAPSQLSWRPPSGTAHDFRSRLAGQQWKLLAAHPVPPCRSGLCTATTFPGSALANTFRESHAFGTPSISFSAHPAKPLPIVKTRSLQ